MAENIDEELLLLYRKYHVPILFRALKEIEQLREIISLQQKDIIELRSEIQRMTTIVNY